MIGVLENAGIECLTATVSKKRVPIADVLKDLITPKKAKRLSHGTGIEALSLASSNVCTSDMCFDSASRLFEKVDRNEIGALLFISQTADYLSPATSYYLQDRLHLQHDILAFDINLGCSGFCYGVFLAALLLPALNHRKVLLCCGDTSSRNAYPEDTSMLSVAADAGAAAIVSEMPNERIYYNIDSFGELADLLLVARGGYRAHRIADEAGFHLRKDNYVVMDGMGVMDFTIHQVPENIRSLMKFSGIHPEDVDLAVLHQANAVIVKTLAEQLGLSEERVPFKCGYIGNTSSASIPVCLSELSRLNELLGGKYLLSGFGVGMSIASLWMNFSKTDVLGTGEI